MEYFDKLLGKTISEALDLTPLKIRVVKTDGKPNVIIRDRRLDRLNVEIENNLITKVISIG